MTRPNEYERKLALLKAPPPTLTCHCGASFTAAGAYLDHVRADHDLKKLVTWLARGRSILALPAESAPGR